MLRRFGRWLLLLVVVVVLAAAAVRAEARELYVAAIVGLPVAGLLVSRWLRRPRIGSWQDAEAATARWLRRAGCRAVRLTGGSADGGIDVVTTAWAVQVKHTAKRVGRPAVQQLVGAAIMLDREPALFSTSGFSAPALAYADDYNVALFELDLDGNAVGVNSKARQVGRRSRRLLRR